MDWGIKLKELRESRNMSQSDLALSSGIERSEVSKLESGQRTITLSILGKLAESFKMSRVSLLVYLENLQEQQSGDALNSILNRFIVLSYYAKEVLTLSKQLNEGKQKELEHFKTSSGENLFTLLSSLIQSNHPKPDKSL